MICIRIIITFQSSMAKDKSDHKDTATVMQQDETLQETSENDRGKMFFHINIFKVDLCIVLFDK